MLSKIRNWAFAVGGTLVVLLALVGLYFFYVTFLSELSQARTIARNDHDRAIELYSAALDSRFLLPGFKAEAYRQRGVLYMRKENYEAAVSDLTASLEIRPSATSYRFRSYARETLGQYEEASADITAAIALDPTDSSLFLNRAQLHDRYRNYPAAIEDYSAVMDRDQRLRDLVLPLRARIYAMQNRFEEAAADVRAVTIDGLYDYDGLISRGIDFDGVVAHEYALKDFDEAIKLRPRDPGGYEHRGLSKLAAGDYAGAIDDFDIAIRLDPATSYSHFGRARALYYQDRPVAALKDFREALSLNGTYLYPVLWLHLTLTRAGIPATEDLAASAKSSGDSWPKPIVDFFLGETDEKGLLEAAADVIPSVEQERLCEVYYYLGAERIARGDVRGGRPQLEEALEICPRDFVEYRAAVTDLARLNRRRP